MFANPAVHNNNDIETIIPEREETTDDDMLHTPAADRHSRPSSRNHVIHMRREPSRHSANTPSRHSANPPRTAWNNSPVHETQTPAFLAQLVDVLKQQLDILKQHQGRMDAKAYHDKICAEWKRVGIIADRFFFVVSLACLFIVSLGIFIKLAT